MWRRNKRSTKERLENSVSDKATSGIAKLINGMQHRFGATLNKKTAHLSQRGKIILLIGFCLLFGGSSIYIMVDGLSSPGSSSKALESKSISVPKHFDKTGEGATTIKAFITAEDIKRIKLFWKYMDSLKTTRHGLQVHDSIIKARPGLMDSLVEVERLYGIDSAAKN